MKWKSVESTGGLDPITGYPTDDQAESEKTVPCRFVAGGTAVFKNEDSTETRQKGRISVNIGSELPLEGQYVEVTDGTTGRVHFKGITQIVYAGGTLTRWRIDV